MTKKHEPDQQKAPASKKISDTTQEIEIKMSRMLRMRRYIASTAVVRKGSEFMADRIIGVIITGVIGMLFAAGVFFIGSKPYGEISIANKVPLVDTILNRRTVNLYHQISIYAVRKKNAQDSLVKKAKVPPAPIRPGQTIFQTSTASSPYTDTVKDYQKKIDLAYNLINKTRTERIRLDLGNADTSIAYFANYFQVKREGYLDSLSDEKWKTGTERIVPVALMDTAKTFNQALSVLSDNLILRKLSRTNISFFSEYPEFGLWVVFSVVQIVLWAMIVPLIVGKVKSLNSLLNNEGSGQPILLRTILACTAWPVALLLAFALVFYYFMIDQRVISDQYFLNSYNSRVYIFTILGYGVASLCFGIFIALAKALDQLNSNINSAQELIEIADGKHQEDKFLQKYQGLRSAFENSFFCSALILSLSVLWIGILVSAINSTEAFRFFSKIAGRNAIPNDFVYLMGLMNTVILLIFYVPIKLRFNSLAISKLPNDTTANPTDSATPAPTNSIFSGLSDSLGPLLVTSSPLLASLVHALFGLFSKN